MITVHLLGEAGRRFTRRLELDVSSPAEALHAIAYLFPDWDEFLRDSDARGVRWRVVTHDPAGLSEAQLSAPFTGDRLILAPVVAGKGPVGLLLAGAALTGAGAGFGVGFLVRIGLFFVFQGLAALLSPGQRQPDRAERRQSFLYTGREYTSTAQGQTVPLLYGETMIRTPPSISYGISLNGDG